ncbi:hypothetical protein E05_42280 [Plautia stali symbiont]|nr:hypothetical protein E05_42280 [Plautia stali symbiont]
MDNSQTGTLGTVEAAATGWRKSDTVWMLGLYGTAIGAGVLFLPINAGAGGLIPLLIMAILAFPMTFFAHRALTRFVLSGKNPGADITDVVEEHFGVGAGKLITLLYFFAIYPILLMYSVAITNTVYKLYCAPARAGIAACAAVAYFDRWHDDGGALRRADDCQSDERAGVSVCGGTDAAWLRSWCRTGTARRWRPYRLRKAAATAVSG